MPLETSDKRSLIEFNAESYRCSPERDLSPEVRTHSVDLLRLAFLGVSRQGSGVAHQKGKEVLAGDRQGLLFLHDEADLSRDSRLDWENGDFVIRLAQNEFRQDADAQARFDHRQNRVVVVDAQGDVRFQPERAECLQRFAEVAFLQQQERFLRQFLQRDGMAGSQGVVCRDYGEQFAFFDELRFQSADGVGIDEPEVDFAGPHPFRDAGVIALMQDKADFGIKLLEVLDQARQPMAGDAGDGADADKPRFQPFDLIGFFLHRLILKHGPLDERVEFFAFERQADADPGAVQQFYGQFLFKRGDQLADGRLGVAEFVRGFREAAEFDDFLERKQSFHGTHYLFLYWY